MRWARATGWRPSRRAWRVAVGFMAGSVLFALGSLPSSVARVSPRVGGPAFVVGAVVLSTTGQELSLVLVNSTTALGAPCFLVGAWLSLPD